MRDRRCDDRKREATERQVRRDQRSASEQMTVLDGRPGESKKERARLCRQLQHETVVTGEA